MGRKTKLTLPDGQEIDVSEEQFEIVREEWNEYRLLDGGTVRVKTSVQRIFRPLDAQGKLTRRPDGDPEVIVRHATEIVPIE